MKINDLLSIELLTENVSEGVCIFTCFKGQAAVEFLSWNKVMTEITGYTIEEIGAVNLINHLKNKNGAMEDLHCDFEKSIAENSCSEYEIISKYGSAKRISAKFKVLKVEKDKNYVLLLVKDLTRYLEIEGQIKEIEDRYNKILEFANDAVFVHDGGRIIYANNSAKKMLNAKSDSEVIGQDIMKFVHPEFYDYVAERIKLTKSEESLPLVEEKFLTLDGKVLYVEVAATYIFLNSRKYNLVFVRDISERKRIENALKDSEAMLRRVTENTLDLISICDEDGNFIYATPSHLTVLGFSPSEVLKTNIWAIVHPEEKELVYANFEGMRRNLETQKVQCRCLCSDGRYKSLEVIGKPLFEEGRLVGFVLSSRDITKRVEAEKALRKSERKYRQLFNNVNDSIYLYKLNEDDIPGKFMEVNDIACKRLGYSREELSKMTILDFNPFVSREMIKRTQKTLLSTGHAIHRSMNVTRNGRHIPVEVNSILFTLNDEKCVLSICRDITGREESERALRESEERYRSLIETLPYSIFIRTRDRVLFSNKAGINYIGAESLEELISKPWREFVKPHPEYEQQFYNNIKLPKEEYNKPFEEKYIRLSDNKTLDMETMIIGYSYGNMPEAYMVVVRDISDRKMAEELRMDMEEKSKQLKEAMEYEKLRTEFFANISHELRTPINVIFSTLQLMNLYIKEKTLSAKAEERLCKNIAVMKQNCYRLIRIVSNLIDASRIDAGFFSLNLSNNNIVSVVENITLSVAEYIENKHISLLFDTDIEEKLIACDPDKIERIMLNLISNAVKFTEAGGNIYVTVTDKNDSILISVKDTGIGISEDKQKLIFERFVQVDKSLTRCREGSGIGLSLVKALVEMHEGNILVKSEPNLGSEFIIELPVRLVEEDLREANIERFTEQVNIEKISIEFSDIY